ncbi:MAG TPA: ATP-binding protein [Chloroflexota bacterium]|nr:ATP-binding protein [Chloroflexota bacterium]
MQWQRGVASFADTTRRLVGAPRALPLRHPSGLETRAAIALRLGGLLETSQVLTELRRLVGCRYGYDQVEVFSGSTADGCLRREPSPPADRQSAELPLTDSGVLGSVLGRGTPVLLEHHRRVVLPMRVGRQVVGVIDLRSRGKRPRQAIDLVGLQWLGDLVGVVLHNCERHARALTERRQAEDADRLKTRLLANVSHELRAPLNVILGYSQAALASPNAYGVDLPAALRRDLEHIYASGDHLRRLINDLLDLSRAEVDALDLLVEPIQTRTFLEQVLRSSCGRGERPNVTWRLDVGPHLPVVRADPVRLRQVLDNLLNNARAATSAGEIVLGASVEAAQLHVWVKDTGKGIAADRLERIFEPFVSGQGSDSRKTGVGLGLAITRRLVALHGGTLGVESEPGRGSTFHVRLPLSTAEGESAGGLTVLMKPAAKRAVLGAIEALQPGEPAGTILIVDDDPDARALYSRLVGEALPYCRVQTAERATEALALLEAQHDPPTLVILDLAMPEVDGFEVLERLRADRRTQHVPVLVVSGRLLSEKDVRRLDHARVLYQPKDLLLPAEALEILQAAAAGCDLLPRATSAVVKQAMAYLHEHYARPLARHDLAQAAGVSENYLSQIFHRELGVSPSNYLSRVRVHQAKELLSRTDDSISVIASRVGFQDPAYFSRVFHKLVGASPQTYRSRD